MQTQMLTFMKDRDCIGSINLFMKLMKFECLFVLSHSCYEELKEAVGEFTIGFEIRDLTSDEVTLNQKIGILWSRCKSFILFPY